MDTTQDIRILFLEKVVTNLQGLASSGTFGPLKRHPQVTETLREMAGAVAALRYSYVDAQTLAQLPEVQALEDHAGSARAELAELNKGHPEQLALLRFHHLSVREFRHALERPAALESCVPVEVGAVTTVSHHPQARKLLLCQVDVFGERLRIVTNLMHTRAGNHMKVALVHPAEVMSILSEAQFVGSAGPEEEPGARGRLSREEQQEIRRSVGRFLEVP
jgi:predicted RNA-binding protein with EMAP domain